MKDKLNKFIFKILSIDNYLRLLQRSYFLLYRIGILKFNRTYDLHYYVQNLIKKGDTVIDIGANLGYYSVLFSKWVGKTGHVYAVEPIELYNKIFKEATKNCNNITLYPYALGLEKKEIEMVNPLSRGYLRTGLPHVYDENRDGNIDQIEYRFKSQMKRPSLLFQDLTQIDYIKCDVEGFEQTVLSEMKDLIDKFKPIVQVEVWRNNDPAIRQLFKDMGYKLYYLNQDKLQQVSDDSFIPPSDYIFIHSQNKIYK